MANNGTLLEVYRMKARIQPSTGMEYEVVHAYPISQEAQHCFDLVNCDCGCCYPDVYDYRDEGVQEVLVEHKWIQ